MDAIIRHFGALYINEIPVEEDASSGYKHNFPERPVLHLESRIVPTQPA